ncbi:RWD domain-containing protein 4-like [Anneissia japonica]|uniref:RWD domain-containing protein 4-like n=1 Tax=Anneissia japonica TaxID=1529436 RepID=UPI0014256D1A|nr:RWD domain-containing protein 4-like [Anneissia japonica]
MNLALLVSVIALEQSCLSAAEHPRRDAAQALTSIEVEEVEEREVLQSIYEGDENFKELNPTTFQYRVGDIGHFKSFLLEIAWGDNYPTELPNINFDTFYINHM